MQGSDDDACRGKLGVADAAVRQKDKQISQVIS